MAIEWNKSYLVHIKMIDEQHKHEVGLINRLYEAINSGRTKEELGPILDALIEYSKLHFKTEEGLFKKFKYEHAAEHKKEHRKFTKKMLDAKKKLRNNDLELSFELIDFLEDWLLDHIAKQDQKYVECFHKHGLK